MVTALQVESIQTTRVDNHIYMYIIIKYRMYSIAVRRFALVHTPGYADMRYLANFNGWKAEREDRCTRAPCVGPSGFRVTPSTCGPTFATRKWSIPWPAMTDGQSKEACRRSLFLVWQHRSSKQTNKRIKNCSGPIEKPGNPGQVKADGQTHDSGLPLLIK